jgi:hypothetical protein
MFRQYFQTEEEDAAGASSGEEEPEPVDELPAPEEVWAQVSHPGITWTGRAVQ